MSFIPLRINWNNLGDQLHVLITNWPDMQFSCGTQQWCQLSTLEMKELIDTAGELNVAVEEEWHTAVVCYIACQTVSAYHLMNKSKTHHRYVGWWGYLLAKEKLLQAVEVRSEPERVSVRQLSDRNPTELSSSKRSLTKCLICQKACFRKCYKSRKVSTAWWPSWCRKLWLLSWH